MRRLIFLVLFSIIMLFSCERSSFSYSTATLRLNKRDDKETLIFSIALSGEDDAYEAVISSPDDALKWQGTLNEDGDFHTLSLDITETSSFIPGLYSFTIYGSGGTEISESLSFNREDPELYSEDGLLKGSASGEILINGEEGMLGGEVKDGDEITYLDQFFNRYSFSISSDQPSL